MTDHSSLDPLYQAFLQQLTPSFSGDIVTDLADRLAAATDNSVYQVIPQAVVYPRHQQDVVQLLSLAHQPSFQHITFTARAGGTGTNGQSLTTGIVVNFTKYMNKILSINLEEKTVTVEAGVVLDQLNDTLKPHGYFFSPHLSPSNRATLGGMVNTDASGKGSCHYGKTSQHIAALTIVLSDGTLHTCQAYSKQQWQQFKNPLLKQIYQTIADTVVHHQAAIKQHYPPLLRYLSGYDWVHVCDAEQTIDLSRIISGSEGSLALVTSITLRLTPLPAHKVLAVVMYRKFEQALHSAQALLATKPDAIETIDHSVMQMAQQEIARLGLTPCFTTLEGSMAGVINLVEYVGDNYADVTERLSLLKSLVEKNPSEFQGLWISTTPEEISRLWQIRAKSVELISQLPGPRKPVSGIEDTVVPPEKLAHYVRALRKLLDQYHLTYSMYGHIDVGCLHVRPALNLQSETDERRYHELSDATEKLVRQFGGLLWGEHGKGFRSQYLQDVLGDELYQACRQLKACFDPCNQFNPGKLFVATDSDIPVVTIEGPKRGHYDKQIEATLQRDYPGAVSCNGNGLCFHYNPNHLMCPSYKVTRDPLHSPNGRANALREWMRLESLEPDSPPSKTDYAHQVYRALHGCLGCNACATQCPVQVTIPIMKSRFLNHYYKKYKRPLRDYVIGYSEHLACWQRQWPFIFRCLNLVKKWGLHWLGLDNSPPLSNPSLASYLEKTSQDLPVNDEEKPTIVLLCDQLTASYDAEVIVSLSQCIRALGYPVFLWQDIKSGKPLQVLGFLNVFNKLREANQRIMKTWLDQGACLLGVDPSIFSVYRDHYQFEEKENSILLIQEWLHSQLDSIPRRSPVKNQEPYYLFSHCTETSSVPHHQQLWIDIFEHLGLSLIPLTLGCCGMAGSYGYEKEHHANSTELFQMSWEKIIRDNALKPEQLLVTGISCRQQIYRCLSIQPRHPAQVLAEFF
jgi:FAD/FMN-containing dehydrogenase/Fe-S oxidoreductase